MSHKKKSAFRPPLPPELEKLLNDYQVHCRKNGLREGTIAQYEKQCRWFLHNLASCGVNDVSQITASIVITACLSLKSKSYLEPAHTFLRYCSDTGKTDRDYTYVILPYKRPQLIPVVYTEDEVNDNTETPDGIP